MGGGGLAKRHFTRWADPIGARLYGHPILQDFRHERQIGFAKRRAFHALTLADRQLAVAPHHRKTAALDIDAAGCRARIISHFTSRGIDYAIRARLDASVAGQIRGLDESRRQPFIERDGTASETQQTARFLHSMNGTPEAFAAVVQRRRKSGRQELEPGCPQAGDTLSQGGFACRALSTSLCRWSDSQAIR